MCTAQDVDMPSRSTSAYAWGQRMHRRPLLELVLVREAMVLYNAVCVVSTMGNKTRIAEICARMNGVLLITAYAQVLYCTSTSTHTVRVQYRAQGATLPRLPVWALARYRYK
jgi:hypothetical protein